MVRESRSTTPAGTYGGPGYADMHIMFHTSSVRHLRVMHGVNVNKHHARCRMRDWTAGSFQTKSQTEEVSTTS